MLYEYVFYLLFHVKIEQKKDRDTFTQRTGISSRMYVV